MSFRLRLTNEELCQSCSEDRERLMLIQAQIEEMDNRLSKLYDAIETGEFKGGELAPRIKVLSQKKEELLQLVAILSLRAYFLLHHSVP